jgi:hypothetical protein
VKRKRHSSGKMTRRELLEHLISATEKRIPELDARIKEKGLCDAHKKEFRRQRLLATTELESWKAELAAIDAEGQKEAG